ncbi:MAG: DNA polymerase III subunit delta' [Caldiserica bacterium]|nr:DNA polymerase III subunit delta' [Caldisericota bacterium]
MSFQKIIGEDLPINYLKKSINKERISPCYLFHGGIKWVRDTAAREFAKALNCTNRDNGEPCDRCLSCKKIEGDVHPDFIRVKPGGAASRIGINKIREVKEKVHLSHLEGKWKVVVIENAHRLNVESANALLKILEEPPAFTTLILLSPRPELLLPTIVSRCDRVRFFIPPRDRVLAWIEDVSGWEREKASLFYSITGGDEELINLWKEMEIWELRGKILELLKSKKPIFSRVSRLTELINEKVKTTKKKNKEAIEKKMKEIRAVEGKSSAKDKENQYLSEVEEKIKIFLTQILSLLYSLLWDAMMHKKGRKDILNSDSIIIIKKLSTCSMEELEGKLKILEKARFSLERNANLTLTFASIFWTILDAEPE